MKPPGLAPAAGETPAVPELPAAARVLPAPLRERLFTPAYYDLLASAAGSSRRAAWRYLGIVGLILDTLRVGMPRLAWVTLRRSRRVQISVAVVLLVVVSVFLVLSSGYEAPTPRY